MILLCRKHFGFPTRGTANIHLPLLIVLVCVASMIPARVFGQANAEYLRATAIIPSSTAGLVRIPNFPKFRGAWKQTQMGQLLDDPSMQPFVEAQRDRLDDYLQSLDNKIGLRLEDLSDIASGEVVVAWIPFPNDKRRPFTICLVADIRNQRVPTEKVLETLDKDLLMAGWEGKDVEHQGQKIRIYGIKPKPGQLKVEQIAITYNDERIIAADRDTMVMDLLDAVAGESDEQPIEESEEFVSVLRRSSKAIQQPILQGGATVALEWFARPFEMARVIREAVGVERGNKVDIIKLLEGQGFDIVRGVGGVVAINGQTFDLLHRGFVLADQNKFEKAAKMLRFVNQPLNSIPNWVHGEVATFNRLNLSIEDAFWASETLINEAFGDEIFRDIIEGIRDDEDGPQIDIEKNVLPNLDDQVILLTDNTEPAEIDSERMLVAIRVKDGPAIAKAIRKTMEVEPDASKLDVLPEVEIWQVERSESVDDDYDKEIFGDLDLDFGEEETEQAPPLLEHWAIALVPAGPGSPSPYLMFSSHPDLLVKTAKRIVNKVPDDGLASDPEVQEVGQAIAKLGANGVAFDRITRTKLSFRTKYELLRQGKLKDSDTVLGSIYRRIFEDGLSEEKAQLNAARLPPLKQVEQFLPFGGTYLRTTEDGWELNGFLLK